MRFAIARCDTIRLELRQIVEPVRLSVRRVAVAMSSACPFQHDFTLAHAFLQRAGA